MFTGASALREPISEKNILSHYPLPLQALFKPCLAVARAVQSSALFVICFCRALNRVRAICPSFKYFTKTFVAKALPQIESRFPRHILEVGPGTGALTKLMVYLNAPPVRVMHCQTRGSFLVYT